MVFGFDQMRYGLVSWAIEPGLSVENAGQVFTDMAEIFDRSGIQKRAGGKPIVEVFASPEPSGLELASKIREQADAHGLDVICCGFNPEKTKTHLPSSSQSERESTVQRIKGFIDFVSVAAGDNPKVLTGPFYTEHKRNFGRRFGRDALLYLVEGLTEVTNYAHTKNVYLAMELLNWRETNVMNTVADGWPVALKVRRDTGYDNLGLHLDTIHQYREEGRTAKDTSEGHADAIIPSFEYALQRGGFYHLHLSENPRLQWGTGNLGPLTGDINQTLLERGYKGAVVIECFHPDMDKMVGITGRPADQMDAKVAAINSMKYIADRI